MRGICMSGLTSGDWKRSNGPRLRHRQKANAAGKQLILATDCHRASRRLYCWYRAADGRR